jgi:hypothetical protein
MNRRRPMGILPEFMETGSFAGVLQIHFGMDGSDWSGGPRGGGDPGWLSPCISSKMAK